MTEQHKHVGEGMYSRPEPVDHTEINKDVHYPGKGLTAPVEAFNVFARSYELMQALSTDDYIEWMRLVKAHLVETLELTTTDQPC